MAEEVTKTTRPARIDVRTCIIACILSAGAGAYVTSQPQATAVTPASAQSPATTVVVQSGN